MNIVRKRVVVAGKAFRLFDRAGSTAPTGVTYVMVHGVGMSHRYFARLLDALPSASRAISVDLPGFGGAPRPSHESGVREMGRLLAEVLSEVQTSRVIFIGHSMGAQWVLEAARARPDLVSGIVLIGPVVDRAHRTLRAQALALGLDTLKERPTTNALVFGDYLRCGPRRYLVQARWMRDFDITAAVAAVDAPVLVLRGAGDPVVGARWSRELRALARRGSMVEIDGAVHNVHHSHPQEVADAVEKWSLGAPAHNLPTM